MKFGLSDQTLDQLEKYFKQNTKIEKVKIYGSRAMGNYQNGSDIDLAFWGNFDFSDIAHLSADLDELSTPYLFDVLDYNQISHQPLKEHINQYGKVLYEK